MKNKHYLFSLLAYILSAIYITFPLIFNMGKLVKGYGDELVIAWIQNWVLHSFSFDIFSLFEANLYYPFHNSLAFSDLFITSSILSFLPMRVLGEPIVAFNFTFISSLILLGFSIYCLAFYFTKNFFASLLAGLLVIFSPAVLDKSTHLQILAVQWVPLAILFFFKFIDFGKTRFLVWSLIFFLIQTYNSFMPGYFIVFSYLFILIFSYSLNRKRFKKIFSWKNVALFIISLLLLLPIVAPYFQVSREFHYVRDIRDSIHFALQFEDFFLSSEHSRLSSFFASLPINQKSQNDEFKFGYLGLIFSILCLFALFYFFKNIKKSKYFERSLMSIALLGLVLCLGPFLHLGRQTVHWPFPIPLPYALFYYILPGFNGFRNSARWEMLFILAISVLIAITLKNVLYKVSFRKQLIIYSLLVMAVISEFNFPMKFFPITQRKDFPKEYYWLSTTPKNSAIVELPIYNWNMYPYTAQEFFREYYGTVNFRKSINGYSGFSPPPWQKLVIEIFKEFPSQKNILMLKSLGINYILIHKDQYDLMNKDKYKVDGVLSKNGNEVIYGAKKSPDLKLVRVFGNTYIFELK